MARLRPRGPVQVQDGPDTIWIVEELSLGALERVKAAAYTTLGVVGDRMQIELHDQAWDNTLLREGVVRWEGPGFEGQPCTPQNVLELLSHKDPLTKKVLAELKKRNPLFDEDAKEGGDPDKDPNSFTPDTSAPLKESTEAALSGDGMSRSSSLNGSAGSLSESGHSLPAS